MSEPGEDGFLSRWSRLKRSEPAAEDMEGADSPQEPDVPDPEAVEDTRTDAEILEELGLPDPDSLTEGDDFKAFMASAVPQRLRNRALRRLWISNPVLANLDELLDYGEDFTDAATVVENLQTAWQVGKGFLRDVEEVPEGAEADAAVGDAVGDVAPGLAGDAPGQVAAAPDSAMPESATPDSAVPEPAPEEDIASDPAPAIASSGTPLESPQPQIEQAEAAPPLPRRMRFRVDPA